jgi:hypothetical protein
LQKLILARYGRGGYSDNNEEMLPMARREKLPAKTKGTKSSQEAIKLSKAERFLVVLVASGSVAAKNADGHFSLSGEKLVISPAEMDDLARRDLVARKGAGAFTASEPGQAWAARHSGDGDPFRQQHGQVTRVQGDDTGARVDVAESPLLWLHRRRDGEGRRLIGDAMFAAGERLRADFTFGSLAPRMSANWESVGGSGGTHGPADLSDSQLAARQRITRALDWVGPELSGVLLDVCCFLKRLEDVERDRHWPARSAKIVLSLALEKLARHYGYSDVAEGPMSGRGIHIPSVRPESGSSQSL